MLVLPSRLRWRTAWYLLSILNVGSRLIGGERLYETPVPTLCLPITVDGSLMNLTFRPLDDLEALARAFVSDHGLKGGEDCPNDECMVDMVRDPQTCDLCLNHILAH
jgi:hypothetical protein